MSRHRDLDALARDLQGRTPLGASVLLFTIVAVIVTAFLWAFLAKVDDVTRAPGKVVPAGDVQKVQSPMDGVISAVRVEEGAIVQAGEALLELDAPVQTSQLASETQRALALQARIERLQAEIEGRPPIFADALLQTAPDLVASERALHAGREAEMADQVAVLERQRLQRFQEQQAARLQMETATRSLAILTQERDLMAPLVERGIEPRTSLFSLDQRNEELTGSINLARATIERMDSALLEIDDSIRAMHSRFRAEALRDLSNATAELASLKPSLPALETLADRAIVRAPTAGVVNRLHRTTLGGAVRAGEDVAEIVPLGDRLLVEAYVQPKDIAFLHPGQPSRVKLTAYDFTRYGALDGTIRRIGANAVRASERDEAEVFVITVETTGAIVDASGAEVQILPGMTAEVDFLAGKRRVIDYLLQPLERVRERAFRE